MWNGSATMFERLAGNCARRSAVIQLRQCRERGARRRRHGHHRLPGYGEFCCRSWRHRSVSAARTSRSGGRQRRVHQICGAGVSRAAFVGRSASRFRAVFRAAGNDHRVCFARTRSCAYARNSPTCPTSIPRTRCGARTRANACSSSATGCGTPTARSSGCRRARRCSMPARSHRSAGTPNLPTNGRPMMRCPTR